MDCPRDLALLLIKVLFNIIHPLPSSIFTGGHAAELFEKVRQILAGIAKISDVTREHFQVDSWAGWK